MKASTIVVSDKESIFQRIKNVLKECRSEFKNGGIKAVFKRFGWKIFFAFFMYYLIRDLIIYVLIPYLFAKHFIN
jgi:hypothetical protein